MHLPLSAWAATCLLLLHVCNANVNAPANAPNSESLEIARPLARRDHNTRDYFAVHLHPGASPNEIAHQLCAYNEGPLGELPDHYTFSCPKEQSERVHDGLKERRRRKRELGVHGVLWSDKQQLRHRHVKRIPPPPPKPALSKRKDGDAKPSAAQLEAQLRLDEIAVHLDIQDPIFKEQWHLFNTVQLGHDLNVTGLWLEGITGNGSTSAVIDDGLDMHSGDLKDNYWAEGSWDFNDHTPEPLPRLYDDKHGTRCAGEIAASRNDVCGVGIAYDSRIAGLRILSAPVTDVDEASAINYRMQDNQIYSCSWGPPDDGATMDAPSLLIRRAIVNGIQRGRGGLGSVFVFAAGNGANQGDNCNFDGYTNSIYSITVGGIDREGNHPYYSEACSAQLVVTYSSGANDAIHTTDVGQDKCYNRHGGTSAAGPLVAGTIALALSVRPELSWRDLQYLCVHTAVPFHLDDGDWQTTVLGKKFSHAFGYGKVDAYSFVQAAKNWQLVKPQAWYHSPWISVLHDIPQGDQGLAASFDVTAEALAAANVERLEHITLTMNANHTRRGDLSVELHSPSGLVSHLSVSRPHDEAPSGYKDWTFMSVVHWGETGVGTWTIIVKDTVVNEHTGTFIDWRLSLWGESIDASKQELIPLPDEHDDDHETATAVVSTTVIGTPPTPISSSANPSDHIDRPTKPRPSSTDAEVSATPTGASESASETASASASASETASEPTSTTEPAAEESDSESDGFLSSFPSFGVSKKTKVWIYSALGLILVFCSCLGIYFLLRRRRRQKNARDGYEFEMVRAHDDADDDEDDPTRALNRRRGQARRGGELYAAFAGESDEDGLVSEDDADEDYRDTPDTSGGSDDKPDEQQPGR